MTEHTPGPWEVRDDDRWGPGVYAVKNPHGYDLDFAIVLAGSVNGDHRGEKATGGSPEANARLIAAAPDLLTAAIEAKAAMDNIWQTKGRDDDFIYDEMGSELSAGYFSLRAAIEKAKGVTQRSGDE